MSEVISNEKKKEESSGNSGKQQQGKQREKNMNNNNNNNNNNKDQKKNSKEDKGGNNNSGGGRGNNNERENKNKGDQQQQQPSISSSSASTSSSSTTAKRNNQSNSSSNSSSNQPPPRLALFDHLPKPRDMNSHSLTLQTEGEVYPSIERYGLLSKNGIFNSDDDRAQGFLLAIRDMIENYTTPQSVALKNDLLRQIKYQVNYLVMNSRVHSMGMGNIIKFIYYILSKVPLEISEADAKSHLINELDLFQEEKLFLARKSICKHFHEMIKENEVIVTYGSSPLLRLMLSSLVKQKKSLRIIVIDSMPHWEGLRTLQSLQTANEHHHDEENEFQQSSYVYAPLSGAANAIKDSSRVILGASGLLSNGSVFAPAGTGMIACLAHYYRVPVIFAAESYKFTDKVQMDSVVYNELSDPLQLMKLAPPPIPLTSSTGQSQQQHSQQHSQQQQNQPKHAIYLPRERHEDGQKSSVSSQQSTTTAEEMENLLPPRVQLFNLNYDLTPINNVSAILTEVGLIPPTSIPVLLRELKYDVNG